jgi:hypothetical protein
LSPPYTSMGLVAPHPAAIAGSRATRASRARRVVERGNGASPRNTGGAPRYTHPLAPLGCKTRCKGKLSPVKPTFHEL